MLKRILPLILALLLTVVSFGCAKEEKEEEDTSPFSDPAEAEAIRTAMRHVIHAAGRLEGPDAWGNPRDYDGSNSIEGLEQCAAAGETIIELDFNFTADGQLACIHDWYTEYADEITDGVALTLDEFLGARIFRHFTPAWIGDVTDYLRAHPDVYIVTDIKDDNIGGCRAIAEAAPDLKNRFLIQIYREDEYEPVRALGFEYVIFTVYALDWNAKTDWAALGAFAAEHPLIGFTFPAVLCDIPGYVEGMKKSGVPLYVHTVNEGEEAYFAQGISGVYTDIVR